MECGVCGKPIIQMNARRFIIVGGERKEVCVFCYTKIMLHVQGRG